MKTPITHEGIRKVQDELDFLTKQVREELRQTISDARELGDLKENAEYHAAKERQSQVEGRIAQLQGVIAGSTIIDISGISSDKVVFGATVKLLNLERNEKVIYQIVGEFESDSSQGKISLTSPLGKALLGREEGDTVIVRAPKGDIEYEVEEIQYI